MISQLVSKLKYTFDNIFTFLLGLITLFLIKSLLFIASPIICIVFIYRWILTKHIASQYHGKVGKVVSVPGHFMASEFCNDKMQIHGHTRSSIVGIAYGAGHLSYSDAADYITKGWLTPKPGEHQLKYPEFQQYLEMWKGYMFWKPDPLFCLHNHLHVHRIPESSTKTESEKILRNLIESLLNKPFPPKRSPWEMHLVYNFKNPFIPSTDGANSITTEEVTVMIFRIHHGMADGFAVIYALFEALSGQKLLYKHIESKHLAASQSVTESFKKAYNAWICVPCRIIWDLGYLVKFSVRYGDKLKTPYGCPDRMKQWKVGYDQSEVISMEKIKFIKNQLKVSFTSVLLSAVAAGVAFSYNKKGLKGKLFPVGIPIPLAGHSGKLRNHATGTVLELNINKELSSYERLKDTDIKFLDCRKYSQIPRLCYIGHRVVSVLPTLLVNHIIRNRQVSMALSNFPGPPGDLEIMGKKLYSLDFTAGGQQGIAGVTIGLVSYGNRIRFALAAELAVVPREELREIVIAIQNEIDKLYEYALRVEVRGNGKRKLVGYSNSNITVDDSIV